MGCEKSVFCLWTLLWFLFYPTGHLFCFIVHQLISLYNEWTLQEIKLTVLIPQIDYFCLTFWVISDWACYSYLNIQFLSLWTKFCAFTFSCNMKTESHWSPAVAAVNSEQKRRDKINFCLSQCQHTLSYESRLFPTSHEISLSDWFVLSSRERRCR